MGRSDKSKYCFRCGKICYGYLCSECTKQTSKGAVTRWCHSRAKKLRGE